MSLESVYLFQRRSVLGDEESFADGSLSGGVWGPSVVGGELEADALGAGLSEEGFDLRNVRTASFDFALRYAKFGKPGCGLRLHVLGSG